MPLAKNRLGVVALAVAGIAALTAYAFFANRGPVGSAAAPAAQAAPAGGYPTAVELATVRSVSFSEEASAVGSLRSNESVVLRPETAGRVVSIGFKDGSLVSKGALLVALEASTQTAELEQARANRELARATQERNEGLFEKKFISRQALDASIAGLRVQEAAVALAQAKFAKTQLRAPFSGVVGIRHISIGDYVKEGQELINLEDIATLKVDFRLPEAYLPALKPGQVLEVSPDALPGKHFAAEIDAIDPLIDAGGRSISLRARLSNSDGLLRPGMFVRVRIAFGAHENALMIPEQSLVPDPAGSFVYRVNDGKAEKVMVKIGQRRGVDVQIIEGLKVGDVVVAAGQLKLRPGAPLRDVAAPPPGQPAPAKAGS